MKYIEKIKELLVKVKLVLLIPIVLISGFWLFAYPLDNSHEVKLSTYDMKKSASATMLIKDIDYGLITYDLEIISPQKGYDEILVSKPYLTEEEYNVDYFRTVHKLSLNINNKRHSISDVVDVVEIKDIMIYRFQNLKLSIPMNSNNTNILISLTDSLKKKSLLIEKLTIINQDKIMELKAFTSEFKIDNKSNEISEELTNSHENFFKLYKIEFQLRQSFSSFSTVFIIMIFIILGYTHYKLRMNVSEYGIAGFLIAIVLGLLPMLEILNENNPNAGALIGTVRYSVYIWIGIIIIDALSRIKQRSENK